MRDLVAAEERRTGLACWVRSGHDREDMAKYLADSHEWPDLHGPARRAQVVMAENEANHLRRNRDLDAAREMSMVGTMLAGGECTLLGVKARLRVEWPDGPPRGMTAEALRAYGEDLIARARRMGEAT